MKAGKIYATATEDMDALTFGSCILLRHMTFSEARKMPIQEIHLDRVLAELELSQNEVNIIFSGKNNVIINTIIFFLNSSLLIFAFCLVAIIAIP